MSAQTAGARPPTAGAGAGYGRQRFELGSRVVAHDIGRDTGTEDDEKSKGNLVNNPSVARDPMHATQVAP
jgi:hypothetical protein